MVPESRLNRESGKDPRANSILARGFFDVVTLERPDKGMVRREKVWVYAIGFVNEWVGLLKPFILYNVYSVNLFGW